MGPKIGRNATCPCGSGKKWKKCHMEKMVEIGVLRRVHSFDPGDHFFNRYLFGLAKIRDCAIPRDRRNDYDKSFTPVFQNLVEMRMVKGKIEALIKKHTETLSNGTDGKFHGNQIDVFEPIDDELSLLFKDFFIRGHMVIDNLIRHAGHIGFPIGFLFGNEKDFKNGAKKFPLKEDDDRLKWLIDFVTKHRDAWYTTFREIRKKIEHHGWTLPQLKYGLTTDFKAKAIFPTGPDGQSIDDILTINWSNIDDFCQDLLVFLLGLKLSDDKVIVYLPEEQRDKQIPIPYIVSPKDLPGVPLSCS